MIPGCFEILPKHCMWYRIMVQIRNEKYYNFFPHENVYYRLHIYSIILFYNKHMYMLDRKKPSIIKAKGKLNIEVPQFKDCSYLYLEICHHIKFT
jgi:hypothetical protein